MKQKSIFLVVIFCCVSLFSTTTATSISILPVQGLEASHQGIIAWNITGTKVGHAIPAPYNAFGNSYAYYYFATRDKGSFDGLSTTGMHGVGVFTGFSKLDSTLTANGKSISDINLRMESCNLGNDTKQADWDLVGAVETRKYTGGTYAILLNNDTLLTGDMPQLQLTINYNESNTPYDDQTSGITGYSLPALTATSGVPLQVASAFMSDLAGRKIRLNFTSIQPAGQTEYLSGNIFGGFFEIQHGQIETEVSIPTADSEVSSLLDVQIFPSPAQNELHVQTGKTMNASKVSVVNLLGETVIESVVGTSELVLPVSNLSPGVYFCVVNCLNGQSLTRKFVKE
jgi:hypothetical protein